MRRYLIALVVAVTVLTSLFVLHLVMPGMAQHRVDAGMDLPLWFRIGMVLAAFWDAFWWVLIPVVTLACLVFAGAAHIDHELRESRSRRPPR